MRNLSLKAVPCVEEIIGANKDSAKTMLKEFCHKNPFEPLRDSSEDNAQSVAKGLFKLSSDRRNAIANAIKH